MLYIMGLVIGLANLALDHKRQIKKAEIDLAKSVQVKPKDEQKIQANNFFVPRKNIKEYSYEKKIKHCLTKLYPSYEFKKIRPSWLRNEKTGRNLELDFYCEKLNLGIESQSADHYKFIPAFHKTEEAFQKQQARDKLKKELCEKKGVKLICIPYYEIDYYWTDEKLHDFVRHKISQAK